MSMNQDGGTLVHRVLRWAGVGLVVLVLGSAPSAVADGAPPCAATPSPPVSYTYGTDQPVILIGTGDMTTTLSVDRLPTDRYGSVTVASDSDAPLVFTITPPRGDLRPIFAADSPDSLTGALLLDQTGEYTLTVEATGSWAIIVR